MHLSGLLFAIGNFCYGHRSTYYLKSSSTWVVKIIAGAVDIAIIWSGGTIIWWGANLITVSVDCRTYKA